MTAGIALCIMAWTGNAGAEQPVNVQIDQLQGADRSVDYAALTAFGPWDDRNYKLTAADVALLSKDEASAHVPIPAFYRVEMRRANPDLPMTGPGQYPRSALQGFLAKYQGYKVNKQTYTGIKATDDGHYEIFDSKEDQGSENQVFQNFLGGEKRITTPAGASESAVSINPANSNLAIAGTNGPGSGQKMWRSSDGGATWAGPVSLASTCCDPAVGWSPDGSIGYATALSSVVGGGTNVLFYRSTDNGASWNLSATLSNQHASDKEYFHVDTHATSPRKGNIYVAWHDSNVQKFARSSDGGLTFAATQTLDSASRGIGSDLSSDTAGNVYFYFPTTSGGSNPKQIRVLKSTDGGANFAAGVTVSSTNADFDFPIPAMETRRAFIYVSADSDRSGGAFNNSLYVAWTDTATTENDTTASANHAVIRVARSRDGGATWAVSTPHSTADTSSVDRFNQWLSVDRNGRVFVMYYDTRNSSGRSGTDIYYSMSTDGGVTWTAATRLTTVTSKNIVEANEWGDYNGMDMAMNDIMAIYTDNRDESGGTAESKDVYAVGGFAPATGGNVAPVANFSFSTSTLTANFSDSSTDSDGTIASRSWNFGDSTTSTASSPSHTYSTAGTYTVTLTVTDNGGATNSISKSVTVSSAANAPPSANFSFTTSGLTATFVDGSTDSDGTIASRSWNFGDSTTSTATSPSKTYAAAGTYTVTLTVTDNAGATNSISKSVTVTAPPGNVLTNGVAATGLSAAINTYLNYTMVVPAGATGLKFVIAGGTGDADMYVKFGAAPTDTVYDCRPFVSGNAETCTIATAQAGTYFVRLKAYAAFSGVSLTGSYTAGSTGPLFQNTTAFAIADNTTIESPITVSGVSGNAPAALKVAVSIHHTYQGDLKVDLVAPNGTLFNLWNRTGSGTDNIIQTFTVNASAVVANGTWKLRVQDAAAGDTGTLDNWSLQF
ncbi:MAG: PKD domain-containing protein [Tahibacter sp.]